MKSIVFLLCGIAMVSGQILNPLSSALGLGNLGTGWNSGMAHNGMRYPGMMQQSHLSSLSYPTWRMMHPMFRVAAGDQAQKGNLLSDVLNIPKVPSAHEVLTHMALAGQNIRPYVDTIADMLYEQPKTRAVVTPVTSVAPVATMGTVTPVSSVSSMSPVQPIYVPGMSVVRASGNMRDDCGPEEAARWERGMDWMYVN